MQDLKDAVRSFVAPDQRAGTGGLSYNEVVAAIHNLCARIEDAHRWATRDTILELIAPAREIHARSPFIKRLQTWPRQYPGDFETIEYLCEAMNKCPPGTVEYFCESYALTCSAAQQHRNKVTHQVHLVIRLLLEAEERKRVLSLACGGCRDLLLVKDLLKTLDGEFVFNDIDADALTLAAARLQLNGSAHYVQANALKYVARAKTGTPFDLVLAGGLMDYLADSQVTYIIRNVYRHLLKPGGVFYFSNVGVAG